METVKLSIEPRNTTGKGPARQMRLTGKVPAVLYGEGVDTTSIALSPKELLEAVSGEMGANSLIDVDLGGTKHTCLLVDYQIHPVTRAILHADLRKVNEDTRVNVEVPLEFVGKAKGIILGGKLRQVFRKLAINCLPGDIPARIEHDVTGLDVEDIVRVRDLKLPDGVVVRAKPAQTLGGLYGNRKRDEEEAAEAAKADEKKK
jgi:large subunit ribosomal protein L25